MTGTGANASTNGEKTRYGFWLVIAGIAAVLIVFIAALSRWNEAGDVTAVVSSATAVIGTLVGAFFGFQAGSEGRSAAEEARAEADRRALRLAASLEPRVANRILAVDQP